MPVERALSLLAEPFALVLLDPPYAYPDLHGIMTLISGARVIGDNSRAVFEHSPRFSVGERYTKLALQRQKVYGDTIVSIFAVQEERNE
jgi:16S rRNA G966 N2-methylase RsmD